MIIQTEATVLLVRPWSQTSHMVTWLTPEYGRIVTSIKGACRPKSAFLGQYDLFYTCDLLFYRREREGIHQIRECTPLALREPLRHCWRSATVAAYLADLTARVTVSHQESAAVYALLNQTLDALPRTPPDQLQTALLRYELRLLAKLCVMPDLALCPHCHTANRPWLRFSLPSGRFACSHLARQTPGEASISIHRDVRRLFLDLLHTPPVNRAEDDLATLATNNKNRPLPQLLLGLSRFLGIFMAFHLDVPPAVRRVTWEMVDNNPTRQHASLENNSP